MSDWTSISISECCEILDSKRVPINEEERSNRIGDVPYYGANGLQGYINDYIFNETLILIAEDGGYFDEYATRSIAYRIYGKSWVNNHAHILRSTSGYDQDFIFYCLEHKDITPFIKGGTRAKLNQLELRQITIPSPPLLQQRKIARILTTVDNLIEKTEALIAKYQSIKQGMMHDLFTRGVDEHGQLRPPYEEAPELYKLSELGWIPKEWMVHSVGDLANYINGHSFNATVWASEGLPIIRIQNLNGELDFNYYAGRVDPRWEVFPGELLFAWSGMLETSFGSRIWHGQRAVLNQHIFKVVPNTRLVVKEFLHLLLRHNLQRIVASAHGFKSSFVHITRAELLPVAVCVPAEEEQIRFLRRLDKLEFVLNKELQFNATLSKIKSGLMQDLLTGKVRVKVDEVEEVDVHA